MKTYLRVAKSRISRYSYEDQFSLVEDIKEDQKTNQKGEDVKYFELKEVMRVK